LIVAQVSPLNQNQDKILCTAPWPNSEAHGTADVDGRAWQIDSIDDTIWVVCVGGIYTYEKVDIVDIFCSLVRGGNNDDLLPIFIGRVGHAEIAWMCFQVICNSDFTNPGKLADNMNSTILIDTICSSRKALSRYLGETTLHRSSLSNMWKTHKEDTGS